MLLGKGCYEYGTVQYTTIRNAYSIVSNPAVQNFERRHRNTKYESSKICISLGTHRLCSKMQNTNVLTFRYSYLVPDPSAHPSRTRANPPLTRSRGVNPSGGLNPSANPPYILMYSPELFVNPRESAVNPSMAFVIPVLSLVGKQALTIVLLLLYL